MVIRGIREDQEIVYMSKVAKFQSVEKWAPSAVIYLHSENKE